MNNQQSHPEDLLPWYVNGSLADAERQQVEAHVQQCARCAAEVQFLQAVGKTIKQDTETVPAEFFWQRVRRDLRRQEPKAGPAHRWWLPSLAAAALLVITIQGVVLFNTLPDNGFGLAGHQLQGTVLQVKFNPDITEKEMRTVLQSVNGEIVSGPGASGVYRIRLADSDAKILQQHIDRLKADRHVVDYVERD